MKGNYKIAARNENRYRQQDHFFEGSALDSDIRLKDRACLYDNSESN